MKRFVAVAVPLALVLSVAGTAAAGSFSPTTTFTLSNRAVSANPSVNIKVNQDGGEDTLGFVKLTVPHGFALATFKQLKGGESLGGGKLKISEEPACAAQTQATADVKITWKDPTQAQITNGIKGFWHVDITAPDPIGTITKFNLAERGSVANGWTLAGKVPGNNATCPPFEFNATVNQTSSVTHTKLFVNPKNAGTYTFKAFYKDEENDDQATNSQPVTITG
jgi:hypothetical protein